MAYGDARGGKLPGDFRFSDYFGLASSGAVGIIAAILVDLQQSADASALFVMNRWVSNFSNLIGFGELPLYAVILVLMAIGAISIFYFQPVTMQSAFIQGFSVLAALMTMAPADLGGSLEAPMDELPVSASAEQAGLKMTAQSSMAWRGPDSEGLSGRGDVQLAAYAPSTAPQDTIVVQSATLQQVNLQSDAGGTEAYDLTMVINFPNGLRNNVSEMIRRGRLRGRLYNESTKKSYNLFRSSGAYNRIKGNTLTIRTSVPGSEDMTKMYARVEVAGYLITIEEFEAKQGRNANWEINMTPNKTPIFIQRLSKSYWF